MAVASGIGLGLLSKLITSGIQRAGTLIFQKVVRVSRIEQAIKSGYLRNKSVKTAIDDFETVIGNRYGQLTEALNEFLEELERSGIINSMIENALIGRTSRPTKDTFCALHRRAFPDGDDPEVLYVQMTTSFSITLGELSKDRVLLDSVRLVSREIENRLDSVDRALTELKTMRKGQPEPISLSTIKPNLLKVARGLQSHYKQIRVETNKGPRLVDISRIYIPPKLRHRDTKKNADLIANALRVIGPDARRLREHSDGGDWVSAQANQLQLLTYNDVKQSFCRIVILGEPGGGKSTICQNICFDLAKQAGAALISHSSRSKTNAQLQKFPFRVVLRNYEKARLVEPQLRIFEFIARDLANHVALEPQEIRECLTYLLSTGSAVLAFDGLDEILVTAQRRDFVDLVTSFCEQYPLCPALVTSRLVGYDDAKLTETFEELVLEKFEGMEILGYTTKFFRIVAGRDAKDSGKLARKFVTQTETNAADLRANPLMLGLMAWLFNARGDVPTNRPEIYSECAVLMFERWDPDRGIKPEIPIYFDKLQLFTSLASRIFGNPELSAGVERAWLEKEIKSHLASLYENAARAASGAKALVEFITGRAWVMTDIGDGVFAFTHQTFLEYFFARHINESADKVEEILSLVTPKILNREWDVVSHLSIQIKTHRNFRRENEAIDGLAELLRSEAGKRTNAVAMFCAKALEYLVGSESNIKQLITDVFDHVLRNSESENAAAILLQIFQCSVERKEYVYEVAFQLIVAAFKSGDRTACDFLTATMLQSGSIRRPHTIGYQLPTALVERVQSALRPFITERAEQNASMASIAWSWYGLVNKQLLLKFGLMNLYNSEIGNGMPLIDGLSGLCLAASENYSSHFKNSAVPKKDAIQVLSLIGQSGLSGLHADSNFTPRQQLTGPPLSVWYDLLCKLHKNPSAQAGGLLSFLVVTEMTPPLNIEKGFKLDRAGIVRNVLSANEPKRVAAFAQIHRAIEEGKLFPTLTVQGKLFSDVSAPVRIGL